MITILLLHEYHSHIVPSNSLRIHIDLDPDLPLYFKKNLNKWPSESILWNKNLFQENINLSKFHGKKSVFCQICRKKILYFAKFERGKNLCNRIKISMSGRSEVLIYPM